MRNKIENLVKTNKKRYYSNVSESRMGDSRQVYKLLNDLSCKIRENKNIHILRNWGFESPNESEIAKAFLFVAGIGINILHKLPYNPLQTIPSQDKSMFYPT